MHIDWVALGQVFGVSVLMTVGLVGVFTLGIVGTSGSSRSVAARAGAYACYALCAAAVAYGIVLIVGK
ncbi:hypothetical protein [Streptomyces orinoci]|uniref:Secreted protein n=1 Tax=Streptomyces orinoci TaxID=67339 RepID=A0ABV3JX04_STRON|nr:hypothetical protein [Streptomyces orinoci]